MMQKHGRRLVMAWGGAAAIAAVLCMSGCERAVPPVVAVQQPVDMGYQQQPPPQVVYQQAPPQVVYEQHSSNDGLVTGMLLGHMLSGGGYHPGYRGGYGYGGNVHQHTTIVHNITNVYHAPPRPYRRR